MGIVLFEVFLFKFEDDLVDFFELHFPGSIIEELSQIEAIVVGTVAFCVVGRSQNGSLVSVLGVVVEEAFYLLCNFPGGEMRPVVKQPLEHSYGARFPYFS